MITQASTASTECPGRPVPPSWQNLLSRAPCAISPRRAFGNRRRGLEYVLDRDMVVDTTLVGTVLNGLVQASNLKHGICRISWRRRTSW